jgi:hypothetical protein
MRDCQPWSAEDDALLNSLAGDGLSASQIATRMGRSRSSVIGRSYRKGSGVTGRSTASNGRAWTPHERVLIVNPDAPLNVIAERIGRTPQAVSTKRNRIGAPKSKPKPKPVRSVQLTGRLHRRTLVTFAPEPSKAPPEGSKTIVDLGACDCRWPFGDPRDLSTFRYCGQDTGDIDRSYCHAHAMVAAAR